MRFLSRHDYAIHYGIEGRTIAFYGCNYFYFHGQQPRIQETITSYKLPLL